MYFKKQDKVGAIVFTNTDVDDNIEAMGDIQKIWNAIRDYQRRNKLGYKRT